MRLHCAFKFYAAPIELPQYQSIARVFGLDERHFAKAQRQLVCVGDARQPQS
jgi:hypothetical protein